MRHSTVIFFLMSIFSAMASAQNFIVCQDADTVGPIYSTEQNRLNTWTDCKPIAFGEIPAKQRLALAKNLNEWRERHREWAQSILAEKKAGMPQGLGCEYVFCFSDEQCAKDVAALPQECQAWYNRKK